LNNQRKRKFGLSATCGSWGLADFLELFMEGDCVCLSCWFRKSMLVAGESPSERRCSYLDVVPLLPSQASTARNYGEKASIQGRHWEKPL